MTMRHHAARQSPSPEAPSGELPGSFEHLTTLLYAELKRLAHFELRRRRPWETFNTTGLVHETYLKIEKHRLEQHGTAAVFKDRGHFLASAAQAMRHILVDAARRRLSAKQGAGQRPEPLPEALISAENHAEEVLAVDQALAHLRALDKRLCRVVECRFFAGLSEAETAEALGVSERTVRRDWIRAKGWLRRWLGPASAPRAGAGGADHG